MGCAASQFYRFVLWFSFGFNAHLETKKENPLNLTQNPRKHNVVDTKRSHNIEPVSSISLLFSFAQKMQRFPIAMHVRTNKETNKRIEIIVLIAAITVTISLIPTINVVCTVRTTALSWCRGDVVTDYFFSQCIFCLFSILCDLIRLVMTGFLKRFRFDSKDWEKKHFE